MNDKVFNAINDPNVTFFLFPTPQLRAMIEKNEHPHIKSSTDEAKAALLSGQCLAVSKSDVLGFINGTLHERAMFLLKTGEVRVAGAVQVMANAAINKGV